MQGLIPLAGDRGAEQRRFVRLSRAGYEVSERELRYALPSARSDEDPGTLFCWTRKDRVYLDSVACRQLRARADAAWDRLAESNTELGVV